MTNDVPTPRPASDATGPAPVLTGADTPVPRSLVVFTGVIGAGVLVELILALVVLAS